MKINKVLNFAKHISIFKTLRFNFHYFSWGGVIHPYIIVSRNLKILKLKGIVSIENPSLACIKIGFPDVGIFDYKYERSMWQNDGCIVFEGKANIGQGTRIANHGLLKFGDNFSISANSSIVCSEKIFFGKDIMISWDVLIMDGDFHSIVDGITGEKLNCNIPITIGNHVWICCRSTILKGTSVDDNNIIAAGSIISGKIDYKNTIISSNKRILKNNINWER